MNFLEKLNYLMAKNNLNKNSLSKACNIPYTTIDGWYKKGHEGLKLTTLRKLAKFFNTTLDYWVNDSDSNDSNSSILIDSSINKSSSKLEINERIKLLQKQLCLTQKEFGNKIGIAQDYLTNIENSRCEVSLKIIKLICSVYNVNEQWLKEGEGEIFSTQVVSIAKKQVLESINALNDEQVNAVSSFIKYLTENKNE